MNELADVESVIGYEFDNKKLLMSAFTHSSYVNEHAAVGNERLEFLGDCVLGFIVGERLFAENPTASEGVLSARRAALVSRAPLARIVDKLEFINVLRVGVGVRKSDFSDKARSDMFEALIGAVYLDGGLDSCRKVLDRIFFGDVTPERDYKSELQVIAVSNGNTVTYETTESECGFVSTVTVGNRKFSGTGKTKHGAEKAAAQSAIAAFDKE